MATFWRFFARHWSSGREPNFAALSTPIFDRATITLGSGPHCSVINALLHAYQSCTMQCRDCVCGSCAVPCDWFHRGDAWLCGAVAQNWAAVHASNSICRLPFITHQLPSQRARSWARLGHTQRITVVERKRRERPTAEGCSACRRPQCHSVPASQCYWTMTGPLVMQI